MIFTYKGEHDFHLDLENETIKWDGNTGNIEVGIIECAEDLGLLGLKPETDKVLVIKGARNYHINNHGGYENLEYSQFTPDIMLKDITAGALGELAEWWREKKKEVL